MASAPITLAGTVRLQGEDRHVHATRRLREAFPGIHFVHANGASHDLPLLALSDDPDLAEGGLWLDRLVDAPGGEAKVLLVP